MSQPAVENDAIAQALTSQKTLPTDGLPSKIIINNEIIQKPEPSALNQNARQELARDYLNAANNGTQRDYVEEKGVQVRNRTISPEVLNKFIDAQILEKVTMQQVDKHMAENQSNKPINTQDVLNTVAKAIAEDKVPDYSSNMRNGAFNEIMSKEKNQTSTQSQDAEFK